MTRSNLLRLAALVLAAVSTGSAFAQAASVSDTALIAHGSYLARIAACNDCHTPGYAATGGRIPESEWLTGDVLGWRGSWGTTYPANLRLYMHALSEDQWLVIAKSAEFRPPMPWFILRDMTEQDLRALYRFVRHLGPAGKPAPAYLPPDRVPSGPFVQFPGATQ